MKNQEQSIFKQSEFYVAVGMFVFSGILLWQILTISHADSRLLPLFTLVLTGGSGVGQLLGVLKRRGNEKGMGEVLLKKKELAVLAMLLVSCCLYETLGFYAAIFLLLVGITMILQLPLTPKKVLTAIIYDILLIVIIYFCFAVLLGLVTPTGVII